MKSNLYTRGLGLALLAVLALPGAALAEPGATNRTQEQSTSNPMREQAPTTPVHQAPAQQAPTQQTPVQQAPAQQAPMQQAPAQQAPVQQAPAPAPQQQLPAPTPAPAPAPMPAPMPAPAPQAPVQEVKPEQPKRVRKWGFLRLRQREQIRGGGGSGGCGGRPCGQ